MFREFRRDVGRFEGEIALPMKEHEKEERREKEKKTIWSLYALKLLTLKELLRNFSSG